MQDPKQSSLHRCARAGEGPEKNRDAGVLFTPEAPAPRGQTFSEPTLPPALERRSASGAGRLQGRMGRPQLEEPGPRSESACRQGRVRGGKDHNHLLGRRRRASLSLPRACPLQVPEVRNTSPGWKLKGRGRPASAHSPSPVQVSGRPPCLSLGRPHPHSTPCSFLIRHPWSSNFPPASPSLPFLLLDQACPRVSEVLASSRSPISHPSRLVSFRPLVGDRAGLAEFGTHRVTVLLGRRPGSGGSGRSPPPHTTLLRAGLDEPPLSPLGRSPEHLQLRMGTGQPGAPQVPGTKSSSQGSSCSSRRAGAARILRPAVPISPSPRGDRQRWGPSARRPEGSESAGGVLSGGPGRPRAGRGALGGGKPRGPRRRAPGACPASAPAGRTRARLSARRGRPQASRPESLRGSPGPVEAGPLRGACSLCAGLGPSGSRRAPAAAAAAAAAAPCHGWRQLGAAPLPPPPAPSLPPERAPSPRQLVRPRGPSASRYAARPLPSSEPERASRLEAPQVPCTRLECRLFLTPAPLP